MGVGGGHNVRIFGVIPLYKLQKHTHLSNS